jgi:enoyl-CoA hydratase/carnithine racemase
MGFDELATLEVAIYGGVATITLHRPERLNAYTVEMGAELYQTLYELDRSDEVRAIVVTGAGRAFCAGMDLEAGGDTFADERQWRRTRELEERVRPWNYATPIIAAINGPAVGIGATLPLQWDVRIAGERARIGFVFTRRGITPEAGSTWILPRLVGMSNAMELLLSGRLIDAREALRLGVVSRVVADDELMNEARRVAFQIAENAAPASVGLTKRLLWRQWMESDPREAKALEDLVFEWVGKQPDAAEGVNAFLEKRSPGWQMSKRDAPDELDDLDELGS